MGIFDGAKSAIIGNKAYRTHVDAGKLAGAGKIAEAKEKYDTALRLYEEASRMGSLPPNIAQAYAVLLMREGRFDRAKEVMVDLSKVKNLSDDDRFQLRLDYSIYQWRTGEVDKAIETIDRAAQYKLNGAVYGLLGMYWVDKAKQTGDFDEAQSFNLQALDYDDEDATTLDNLGQLYEAMAEAGGAGEEAVEYRRKAMEFFERAHKRRPRQITTLYYLARLLHRDGNDARARELLSVRDSLYYSAICPVKLEMMDALASECGEG